MSLLELSTADLQRELMHARDMIKRDPNLQAILGHKFDTAQVLKSLHRHSERNEQAYYIHRRYEQRLAVHRLLRECAENGKVLVVESGMDCDCVQYAGKCRLIDANIKAYDELYNSVAEWADGPFSFSIDRPSNAALHGYRSVDLVMEAYENGYRHSVRPHAVI